MTQHTQDLKRARLPIAITGRGWEIPRHARHARLTETLASDALPSPVFEPALQLGHKGLRFKERATLLALCAARSALMDADLLGEDMAPLDATDFGVIVASNTGNLDTVCQTADTIRRTHVDATSAMDLPNASSNIVASTLAIRFGLKALNLMVCSGACASLDALVLAANAIRQGRARRMLVVSVETDGPALRSLLAGRRLDVASGASAVLEGAAAVVLESPEAVGARAGRMSCCLSDHAFQHMDAPSEGMAPVQALFQAHPRKRRRIPAHSFIDHADALGAQSPALAAAMADAYGGGAMLGLILASEQADEGAIVVGGGTWADRRAGALVIEHTGTAHPMGAPS